MMLTRYATIQENLVSASEPDLVKAAQNGDLDAFNQLVLSNQDRIYNLSIRMMSDEDQAEDITQNTFISAYLNLPRFRHGSFRSWLYRIATNLCYDEFRKHKKHPLSSLESETISEERLTPLYDISGTNASPEAEIDRGELSRAIQGALNQLEPEQRTVVVLVDQQELEYQEAAKILGVPLGTVKSRLARARHHLQQLLRDEINLNI